MTAKNKSFRPKTWKIYNNALDVLQTAREFSEYEQARAYVVEQGLNVVDVSMCAKLIIIE